MKRGEVYWNDRDEPLRGNKPGYYVVVGRQFFRDYPKMQTVMCAPVYSQVLGADTEVIIDISEGVRHRSSVRCDLLTQIEKSRLVRLVGRLTASQVGELNQAIARGAALDEPYDL